jgi:hypothetical protein
MKPEIRQNRLQWYSPYIAENTSHFHCKGFDEILAVEYEKHTKRVNTHWYESTEFLDVKAGATDINHSALKG